jgi:hypothetical protein
MVNPIFEINKKDVVYELIDGEAILINMATGSYFSLDGSGAVMWELLQQGAISGQAMVNLLMLRYRGVRAEVEEATLRVLNEMQADGLLTPADREAGQASRLVPTDLLPFEPPVLNKYTDLEALLLFDPIHDVSLEGWPNKKEDEQ